MEGNMSNIQEKAEQYALTKHNQSQCFDSERDQCIDDYTAGYNEAKRWISVGERLPDTLKGGITLELNVVLCKLKNGIIVSAIYYEQKKEWAMYGLDITINDAIEWREI